MPPSTAGITSTAGSQVSIERCAAPTTGGKLSRWRHANRNAAAESCSKCWCRHCKRCMMVPPCKPTTGFAPLACTTPNNRTPPPPPFCHCHVGGAAVPGNPYLARAGLLWDSESPVLLKTQFPLTRDPYILPRVPTDPSDPGLTLVLWEPLAAPCNRKTIWWRTLRSRRPPTRRPTLRWPSLWRSCAMARCGARLAPACGPPGGPDRSLTGDARPIPLPAGPVCVR